MSQVIYTSTMCKFCQKFNSDCLAMLLDWLIETWALVRGLTILVLVVATILMNLADLAQSPISKILAYFASL